MQKLRLLTLVSIAVIAASSLTGCVHEGTPTGKVFRSSAKNITAQLAYAKQHFKSPNTSDFGNLGGRDCVNFVSQTLLARGWKMTDGWAHDTNGSAQNYSRAWISSTGLHDYLLGHKELATELDWAKRDEVAVGDIVQFDWDASGDRDHTAIVSGIVGVGAERQLLLASHSPAAFDWPIEEAIAEHGSPTKVYFWHLYSAGA